MYFSACQHHFLGFPKDTILNMSNKNVETNQPVHHSTTEEDFDPLELRVKVAILLNDVTKALEDRPVDKKTSKKGLRIIILAVSDILCGPYRTVTRPKQPGTSGNIDMLARQW